MIKRKLTKEEKRRKKERKAKSMIIFVNGRQKRVPRPPQIGGMSVHEYMARNADPIWLHQNGMWEYMQADDDSEAVDDAPIQSQRRQSKSCVPDEEDSFEILESFGNDPAGEEEEEIPF